MLLPARGKPGPGMWRTGQRERLNQDLLDSDRAHGLDATPMGSSFTFNY
jgi:hypothetical protein